MNNFYYSIKNSLIFVENSKVHIMLNKENVFYFKELILTDDI